MSSLKEEKGFITETEKYIERFFSGEDVEIERYKLKYKTRPILLKEAQRMDYANIESGFILAETKIAREYLYKLYDLMKEKGLFFTFLTGG